LFFLPGQTGVWFPRMARLDARWVRILVPWNGIAPAKPPPGFDASNPADPSYYWSALDRAVRDAATANLAVLLMLRSPPAWALGRGAPRSAWPGTWRPSPDALGAFAHAVAERYSGHFPDPSDPARALPRVRDYQVWNEPNLPTLLEPQWMRTRRGYAPVSPAIYRALLNAAYAGIKSAQPHAYVLTAGLAPYGDPPGGARVRPVTFLTSLLCLSGPDPQGCPNPAHFDALDIHPYALAPTIPAFNPDDVSVPDLGRLARVLLAAERTGRALPTGRKPIWVTEIDWDSSPPTPGGLSLGQQARYLSRAFYEFWQQSVSHVFWYEAVDPPGAHGAFSGGGVFLRTGAAKPSAAAFRFPFVAIRSSGGLTTLWGRAPTVGPVTIEVVRSGGWRRLTRLPTTAGGIFYARRRVSPHLILRARVGTIASYPWPTS
jgi:hypothetical protein